MYKKTSNSRKNIIPLLVYFWDTFKNIFTYHQILFLLGKITI